MWSASALEHFQEDRFLGALECADLEVQVAGPGEPNYFRLQFHIRDDAVRDVHFSTVRCLTAIACANYACRWALGRPLAEFASLRIEDILRDLGPFPGDKSLWATWVWAAFQQASKDWRNRC